jgi:hypothetical protein
MKLMNKLLKPYCEFHIYIIEQSDDGELFNIGKLKNIGFDIAKKDYSYDNYIFSDIDIIPDYELIKYYSKSLKYPISLALRGTRYMDNRNIDKKIFIGSLLGFSKDQFEKINGYPNNFWGWGGEDDALINRLLNSGYNKIYYPKIGSIIDIEEDKFHKTIDIEKKVKMTNKDMLKYEKLYDDLTSFKKNGLNSLKYKILEKNEINDDTTQITVDLFFKDDFTIINNNLDWKKISKIVYSKLNEMKTEFI